MQRATKFSKFTAQPRHKLAAKLFQNFCLRPFGGVFVSVCIQSDSENVRNLKGLNLSVISGPEHWPVTHSQQIVSTKQHTQQLTAEAAQEQLQQQIYFTRLLYRIPVV